MIIIKGKSSITNLWGLCCNKEPKDNTPIDKSNKKNKITVYTEYKYDKFNTYGISMHFNINYCECKY